MKDFDHLVYYLVLYMYALTNFSTGKNYTVFDHGILVNNAARPRMEFSMVPST